MRAHHAIAAVAIVLLGLVVKLFVFSAPVAGADGRQIKGLDISKMHQSRNLPAQIMHDMTFVYSDSD